MICPDCIVEMSPNKKKLGTGSQKWFVCPKCGCRLKEDGVWAIGNKKELFYKEKDRINSNINEYKEF